MRPFEVLEAVRHDHTTMDKVNDEQNVIDECAYASVHVQRFLKDTDVHKFVDEGLSLVVPLIAVHDPQASAYGCC